MDTRKIGTYLHGLGYGIVTGDYPETAMIYSPPEVLLILWAGWQHPILTTLPGAYPDGLAVYERPYTDSLQLAPSARGVGQHPAGRVRPPREGIQDAFTLVGDKAYLSVSIGHRSSYNSQSAMSLDVTDDDWHGRPPSVGARAVGVVMLR